MNAIFNFFSRLFSPVTTQDALSDLDKAVAKLLKAEDHHNSETDKHIFVAETATKLANDHEYAAIRAARVRAKLVDLIG